MSWLWGRDELDELAAARRTVHYYYGATIVGGDSQAQALFVGSSQHSHAEALGAAVLAMKQARPEWHVGAHVLFTTSAASGIETEGQDARRLGAEHESPTAESGAAPTNPISPSITRR